MFGPGLLLFWLRQIGKRKFIVVSKPCRNGSHSDDVGAGLYDSQSGKISRDKEHWIFFSIKLLVPSAFCGSL